MKYIVCKRFRGKAICGTVNLRVNTECEEKGDFIFYNDNKICTVTSENAHRHFSRDDDGNGILRGQLIQEIQKKLAKRDDNYQKRWDKIWKDEICQRYKRIEFSDFWLWNHNFFEADIDILKHIAGILGIKGGKIL